MGTKNERKNLNMFFRSKDDGDGYFKIKKKNSLVFISDCGDMESTRKIADNFIYIESMIIIPSSSTHKIFYFDFSIRNKKGTYNFKYSNGKLHGKAIISAFKYKELHITDKALFLKACILYCIYYINNIQFRHVCGWIRKNHELFYIGISKNHESSSSNISTYFLTNFMCDKKDYDYTEQQYANYLLSLINLTDKEITYPLLGYVFLSFSYILIEKHMPFPFLNIYKEKNQDLSPSILANLYANVFARNFNFITSVNKDFCLNVDKGKKDVTKYLEKYSDCPMIVTSSNSNISIESGTGKFVIDYIKDNDMRVFPIFLTKKPIKNDQQFVVLKLNDRKFNKEVYDSLLEEPDIMSALMNDFIDFISCGYDMKELSLKTYYCSLKKFFELYKSDINRYKLYVPLNYGIQMLIEFCNARGILSQKQAKDIAYESNNIFKCLAYSDDQTENILESKSVALFIDYISDIFISNKLKPDYAFDENKDRNSGIMCYLLEYGAYYNHFVQTYPTEQILKQKEFELALKSLGSIMTYPDRTQMYMPRKYQSKTYDMLVVIQDVIRELI